MFYNIILHRQNDRNGAQTPSFVEMKNSLFQTKKNYDSFQLHRS